MLKRLTWSAYLAWRMLGQARMARMPLSALRRLQSRRVVAMVRHACTFVPYYRETFARLGLSPAEFRTADDLARLPLLEPAQLQRDPEYFLSRHQPAERFVKVRTAGSTGAPRTVYHTRAAILHNAAHGERERSILFPLIGRRFGYRETIIVSPVCTAKTLQTASQQTALLPARLRIQRQFLSLMDPPEKLLPQVNEFRPDVLHSYGSYLTMFFGYLAETGAPFHYPKAVTYSSDGMAESTRRLIMDRFGIPVFSTYQANEALKIGFECESHLGLHASIDLYPLRIIGPDGRNLPPGKTGEVVISNLVNRATVLLNYRLCDLAAWLPEACPCGRTLPLLSFPPGRLDDLVELPSGQVMHPQAVRTLFTLEDDVLQYQVVQTSPACFTMKVVAAASADRRGLQERVLRLFAQRFGADVTASVSFVESIDRTPGGKFRPVVSLRRRGLEAMPDGGGDDKRGTV